MATNPTGTGREGLSEDEGPSSAPKDSAIQPVPQTALSAGVRSDIDAVYQTGWLATYLKDAPENRPTQRETVHTLLAPTQDEYSLQTRVNLAVFFD